MTGMEDPKSGSHLSLPFPVSSSFRTWLLLEWLQHPHLLLLIWPSSFFSSQTSPLRQVPRPLHPHHAPASLQMHRCPAQINSSGMQQGNPFCVVASQMDLRGRHSFLIMAMLAEHPALASHTCCPLLLPQICILSSIALQALMRIICSVHP